MGNTVNKKERMQHNCHKACVKLVLLSMVFLLCHVMKTSTENEHTLFYNKHFKLSVCETCTLLGYYAAQSGNSVSRSLLDP
jgi:hypothetical protein